MSDFEKTFVFAWITQNALKCVLIQNMDLKKILNTSFLISKKTMFEKLKFFSKLKSIEIRLQSEIFKYFTPTVKDSQTRTGLWKKTVTESLTKVMLSLKTQRHHVWTRKLSMKNLMILISRFVMDEL